jgi:hypothetical protein
MMLSCEDTEWMLIRIVISTNDRSVHMGMKGKKRWVY